jgi:hypothetical protein
MDETKYPLISDGLLLYLKEQFPDKVPMGDITPRELGFEQGIQWVIQHLREVKKWSEEDNVQN